MTTKKIKMKPKTVNTLRKHSTTALGVGAIIGLGFTLWSCIKETPGAMELLEEAENEKEEELTIMEKVKILAPAYKRTIASGALTLGCISSATILSVKNQNKLIAVAASGKQLFTEYRKQVVENLGDEVDEDMFIRASEAGQCECTMPDEKVWWFDHITGAYKHAYEREIMMCETNLNRSFTLGGMTTAAHWADLLNVDVDRSELEGKEWFISDGVDWIDFQHIDCGMRKNGEKVIEIVPCYEPYEHGPVEFIPDISWNEK